MTSANNNEIIKELNLTNIVNENNPDYNQKNYTYNNNQYTVIKYNKDCLKAYAETKHPQYDTISKFRSVIVHANKVVVYSPEKSLDFEKFTAKYPDTNDCWAEDFVDGTMINVFYDNVNETWEIATKSTVGGNIVFFNDIKNYHLFNNETKDEETNNITFRSMFFESCEFCKFDINSLDKKYSYSFIMQHPFNRIVAPVKNPLIYLVKVYHIDNTNFPNVSIVEKNIQEFVSAHPCVFADTGIYLISKYPIATSYEDIYTYFSSRLAPFHCVGSIIYNIDGTRTKIRNINYEDVRKLRGNQPKLQFNYYALKKEGKIKEFLHYYPEHMILFNKFKLAMFEYTHQLHTNYVNCFIKKEKPLKDYEFQYKNHMYKLHQLYKTELKVAGKVVDKKAVINYVNDLHPAQQMHAVNHKYNSTDTKDTDDTKDTKDTKDTNETDDTDIMM
jgi:hypothetical protein